MKIGGILDVSTKDIPHKSSMVLFTVGCNFKCQFCHNKYLLQPNVGRDYSISELSDKISTNSLVSGVSITGGEPTLQNDLLELCQEVKKIGKFLSVDTNGSNPAVIKSISPFIDRVALDLKGPLESEKLKKITGVTVDINLIKETYNFINSTKRIDFEIRTTFVENLLSIKDIESIINTLKGFNFTGNFVLQQYQCFEGVGEEFKRIFSKPEHETLLRILSLYKDPEAPLPFNIFLRDEIVGYCALNDIEEI